MARLQTRGGWGASHRERGGGSEWGLTGSQGDMPGGEDRSAGCVGKTVSGLQVVRVRFSGPERVRAPG